MSTPMPNVPAGFVRLIGATDDELAGWNEKKQLGLFTSLFLDAVAGAADGEGFGNQDGRVEGRELEDYLRDRLPPEAALSTNGREQHPSLDGLDRMLWAPVVTRTATVAPPVAPAVPADPCAGPVTASFPSRCAAPLTAAQERCPQAEGHLQGMREMS
jgi:hypothetical protein